MSKNPIKQHAAKHLEPGESIPAGPFDKYLETVRRLRRKGVPRRLAARAALGAVTPMRGMADDRVKKHRSKEVDDANDVN